MSKSKYPWPISLIMSPHVFADGAELWPSGREEFSYLTPDKRRVKIVVANPKTPSGREYVVFTNTINKFTGGEPLSPELKARVVASLEEYFLTTRKSFRFES